MSTYIGVCPTCGWMPCRCQPTHYYTTWWPPADYSWWKVQYLTCEHCYCKDAIEHNGEGAHRQCCKCGTVMADKFFPGNN
jgi:hypothetical protein